MNKKILSLFAFLSIAMLVPELAFSRITTFTEQADDGTLSIFDGGTFADAWQARLDALTTAINTATTAVISASTASSLQTALDNLNTNAQEYTDKIATDGNSVETLGTRERETFDAAFSDLETALQALADAIAEKTPANSNAIAILLIALKMRFIDIARLISTNPVSFCAFVRDNEAALNNFVGNFDEEETSGLLSLADILENVTNLDRLEQRQNGDSIADLVTQAKDIS